MLSKGRRSAVLCLLAMSMQLACRQTGRYFPMPNEEQKRNIEILRTAYADFNRGDIAATVKAMDPNVEWIEPPEFPGGGTYHGHEGVIRYLTQSRAGWEEGRSEPEAFSAAGDKIVVFVHARVKPKGSKEWAEAHIADVYTFRNGVIVQMRAFADQTKALEWAGAKQPAPR